MELCPADPPWAGPMPFGRVSAYYSNDLKCWVRLVREADGEWCHTSGFSTRAAALCGREV